MIVIRSHCIWKGIFGKHKFLEKLQRIKCFLLFSWKLFVLNNAKESVALFHHVKKSHCHTTLVTIWAEIRKWKEHKLNDWWENCAFCLHVREVVPLPIAMNWRAQWLKAIEHFRVESHHFVLRLHQYCLTVHEQ